MHRQRKHFPGGAFRFGQRRVRVFCKNWQAMQWHGIINGVRNGVCLEVRGQSIPSAGDVCAHAQGVLVKDVAAFGGTVGDGQAREVGEEGVVAVGGGAAGGGVGVEVTQFDAEERGLHPASAEASAMRSSAPMPMAPPLIVVAPV